MLNQTRIQLQNLCGGSQLTRHQKAQLSSPRTRPVALQDLAKVIGLYLQKLEWVDADYDIELCQLALRGPQLISGIESVLFDAIVRFRCGVISFEEAEDALLNARRRPSAVKGETAGSGQTDEDCILIMSVLCIYWSCATGQVEWPPLARFQAFEEKLLAIMGLSASNPSSESKVQKTLEEISSPLLQSFLFDSLQVQYPGNSFAFCPNCPKRIITPKSYVSIEEKFESQLLKAKGNLSSWEQAKQLQDIVSNCLSAGNISKALEVALLIRRPDCQSEALEQVLVAHHKAEGTWRDEVLSSFGDAVSAIPMQTKRVRFGGVGREKSKHLVRLAYYNNQAGKHEDAWGYMANALEGLLKPQESIYDQVDFALLCVSLLPDPQQFFQYVVRKIEDVWNWGDQLRMFDWVRKAARHLSQNSLVQVLGFMEPQLEWMEAGLDGLQPNSKLNIHMRPRTCLHLVFYLADGLLKQGRHLEHREILGRLVCLYPTYIQEKLHPGFLGLIANGYAQTADWDAAMGCLSEITTHLVRCRTLLDLLSLIESTSYGEPEVLSNPSGILGVKKELENSLIESIEGCQKKNQLEFISQFEILSNSNCTPEALWKVLDEHSQLFTGHLHALWQICGTSRAFIVEWVNSNREGLLTLFLEGSTSTTKLSNGDLRRVCEILLRLGAWEHVCRYLKLMERDNTETIQLMNHPLMAFTLVEEFPRYGKLANWMASMDFGELTHRWILRQWRRYVAISNSNACDLLKESLADPDWLGNNWAVRCYLIGTLKSEGPEQFSLLSSHFSQSLEYPS